MQKGVRAPVHQRNCRLCPQQIIFTSLPMAKQLPKVVPTQPSLQSCFHLFPLIVSCLRDICRAENRSCSGQQFLLYFRSLSSLKRLHAWGSEKRDVCMCVWERGFEGHQRSKGEIFPKLWLVACLSRGTLSPWGQDVAESQWNDSEVAQEGSQPPGRTIPVDMPDYIPTITRVGMRRERLPPPPQPPQWPEQLTV